MTTIKHSVNWLEISVSDLPEAAAFYAAVLGKPLHQEVFDGIPHAIFAADRPAAVTGTLIQDPKRPPARGGTVVFLDARDGVEQAVARAREAGGTIVQPVTDLGPHGTCALIGDRDGNVVGLHAPRAGAAS